VRAGQSTYECLWGVVPAHLSKRAGSLDFAMNQLIDRSAKADLNPCKSKMTKGKRIEPN
jgi:hypothetical protein